MKTLHASAIAKLIAKKKITDAVGLLTLVGPDTDLVTLLQAIQELRRQAPHRIGSVWRNSVDELDKMLAALFNAACLHYPEAAETYLRSIHSEYTLSQLVTGDTNMHATGIILSDALKEYEQFIEGNIVAKDEEADEGILVEMRNRILGKVVYDTYVPGLKNFFQDKTHVYVSGSNKNLQPFKNVLSSEGILGKVYKADDLDRPCNYVTPLSIIEEGPTLAANLTSKTKKHRVYTGKRNDKGKKIYKLIDDPSMPPYTIEPIKQWFQDLAKIETIIVTSEYDYDGDDTAVERAVYPQFNLEILFRPDKAFKQNDKDKDGTIHALALVKVIVPVRRHNGYYIPIVPSVDEQKNNKNNFGLRMHVHSLSRTEKYKGEWYRIGDYVLRDMYEEEVMEFVRKIIKEGGSDFKVKAPRLVGILGNEPLLQQILVCPDGKQEGTSAPAAEAPVQE